MSNKTEIMIKTQRRLMINFSVKSKGITVFFFAKRVHTFFFKLLVFIFLLGFFTKGQSQKADSLGIETVTVIKSYSPTISDAFKVKKMPSLNDSSELKKRPIQYQIFSVPVASTYTPKKVKAERVKKTPPPKLYNTYALVGLGNFSNAQVDFYTSREIGREENLLNIGLTHFSSRGDIDDTPLDTDFYSTDLNASLSQKNRGYAWEVGLDLGHQLYNWYGLDSEFFMDSLPAEINETQNYFNVGADAYLKADNSFFKEAKLTIKRFWDAFESAENRAVFNTEIEAPLNNEILNFKGKLDYVGGRFENTSLNNIVNENGIQYGHLIASINPNIMVLRDKVTVNLGANLTYGLDLEQGSGSLFIYPTVTTTYKLLENQVIAYGGIEGGLNQNSYYDFVSSNPFVSPTLALPITDPLYNTYSIQPTNQQYEGYLGLKGQITTSIGYDLSGFYRSENKKPLFQSNPQNPFRNDGGGYTFGNSFQVFYENVKTLEFSGELHMNINKNLMFDLQAQYFAYNTETDNPAWNLPEMQASIFMNYNITDQWHAGVNVFFIGERQDLQHIADTENPPDTFVSSIITLDSFLDANVQLGYRLDDQLSIFVRFHNLANNPYERWVNFRVQGFQALAGVSYQFDL